MPASVGYGEGGFGAGGFGGYTAAEPIPFYQALITSEWQGSPQYLEWLTAVLQILDDISSCLAQFTNAFSIDSAVGVQLDAIGELVGQGRTVGFQPSHGLSPTLDDATYQLLLQSKIAENSWNGTIDGLQAIWQSLFQGGSILIIDNQNMSADITVTGAFTSIVQDLIVNGYIVPRPEGVEYTYTIGDLPFFGFDQLYDSAAAEYIVNGFDTGHWS